MSFGNWIDAHWKNAALVVIALELIMVIMLQIANLPIYFECEQCGASVREKWEIRSENGSLIDVCEPCYLEARNEL